MALSIPDAIVIHALDEVSNLVDNEEDVFIIGGEKVYRDALPVAHTLYLTRIQHTFDADAFFPAIDENKWQLVEDVFVPHDEKNAYDMNFQKWVRKA